MKSAAEALTVTRAQLRTFRTRLCESIEHGLAHTDQEIRALPAYLRVPGRGARGKVAVLDVGGTNMRAAFVEIGEGYACLLGPEEHQIRHSDLMQRATTPGAVSAEEFFEEQAKLLAAVTPDAAFPLGYCFSYPATITPGRDARLIRWTKGIEIAGVDVVGSALVSALEKKGKIVSGFAVLNDTVASLIAGAYLAPRYSHTIGLIVGTGTNMAGFFPAAALTKMDSTSLAGWHADDEMAVNLETGNFDPAELLSPFDEALNAALPPSQQKGQRFEKAVSGAYLPRLLGLAAGKKACAEAGFDPEHEDSGRVAALRSDPHLGAIATALINRSADFTAAGLAGLIAAYRPRNNRKNVGILAEGSLFWKAEGYRARVAATLGALLEKDETADIIPIPTTPTGERILDPNWIGSACAALSS